MKLSPARRRVSWTIASALIAPEPLFAGAAKAPYGVVAALAIQEQYPVITGDRRFTDIVRMHPYLSDRVAHVESLRRG